jgi:hypothetical protein
MLQIRSPISPEAPTFPLEAVMVDDTRVAHGVTPIMRLDPARGGHRDMLVVTFRRR